MTRAGQGAELALALRLARRELRGGLKGFRVFLACLTLGVAAIAGVGSVSQAVITGLAATRGAACWAATWICAWALAR